jgi:hypothetical protein
MPDMAGAKGAKGEKGEKGEKGYAGVAGRRGATGHSGHRGGKGSSVRVPLSEFVLEIAREAAREVIKEHVATCGAVVAVKDLFPRIHNLEIRLVSLIAFMAGAGLLGGGIGALVARLLTGP